MKARVSGRHLRMLFDTGAQLSYLQHALLNSYPAVGKRNNLYPGFGTFETDT